MKFTDLRGFFPEFFVGVGGLDFGVIVAEFSADSGDQDEIWLYRAVSGATAFLKIALAAHLVRALLRIAPLTHWEGVLAASSHGEPTRPLGRRAAHPPRP